jgi:adenosylcobinamide-GDP ribazoletransferase
MADRTGFLAAVGLFTIVPVPNAEIDRMTARRAVRALPWLGLVLGLVAALAAWLVGLRSGPLLVAVVGVTVPIALTGAMHLDGLADTADGLGSRKPAAEALDVMRRSDIGPMGVVSIVIALLVQVAAIASIDSRHAALVVIALQPLVGRVTILSATGGGIPLARAKGFGTLVGGVTSIPEAAVGHLLTLVVCGAAGWWQSGLWGAWAMGVSFLAAIGIGTLWRRHLARRLGGLTGDTFGSLIEVSQTAFALVAALMLGVL